MGPAEYSSIIHIPTRVTSNSATYRTTPRCATKSMSRSNLVSIPLTSAIQPGPSQHKLFPSTVFSAEGISSAAVFCLLNVRSLANKSFLCQDFILSKNKDFLFISESWLSPGQSAPLTEAGPPNYSSFNQPRLSGRGGRVAVIFY